MTLSKIQRRLFGSQIDATSLRPMDPMESSAGISGDDGGNWRFFQPLAVDL